MPPIRHFPLTLIVMLAISVLALVAYDPDDPDGQLEDVVGKVVDGDTLYVGTIKIRLEGIAPPEMDEPFGLEARDFLTAIALGRRARCDLTGEHSFDRQVTVCRIDGRDLGQVMVEAGLARDCPRYSGGRYEVFEPRRRPPPCRAASRRRGGCARSRAARRPARRTARARARRSRWHGPRPRRSPGDSPAALA